MSAEGSTRAIVAAFFANLGIAVAKFVGFLFTRSSSMLAESIHSVADTGNQGLLLLGGRRSRRPATTTHQFGFGRERYFWAFIVALVLFLLGSLFALFEGVEKIRDPHELESVGWAVGILIVAVVLESWSFRTAVRESAPHRGADTWWAFIRRSRRPELPVVLLEDAAALVGLMLALTGVGLATITGDAVWDGVGTLAIGVLLGVIAVTLAVEMKSLLIGESASAGDEQRIRSAIESSTDVISLIHLRTEHIGPDEILVAAKVAFEPDLPTAALAARIDEVEAALRAAIDARCVVYIEPDLLRASREGT